MSAFLSRLGVPRFAWLDVLPDSSEDDVVPALEPLIGVSADDASDGTVDVRDPVSEEQQQVVAEHVGHRARD